MSSRTGTAEDWLCQRGQGLEVITLTSDAVPNGGATSADVRYRYVVGIRQAMKLYSDRAEAEEMLQASMRTYMNKARLACGDHTLGLMWTMTTHER